MRTLRIAGAALNQTPVGWKNNLDNIRNAMQRARKDRADLICFSELAITGYGCEDLFLSEWLSVTAWSKLEELIPDTDGITACIGLPVRREGITYNGVAVVADRKIQGIAFKQNLPADGIHYEPRWFVPWKRGEVVTLDTPSGPVAAGDLLFECKGVLFGFEICEDAWRPVRPAEELCRKGADLILNPSASHFAFGKSLVREKIVTESSLRFDCTFMMVNQLGNEAGKVIYDGDILIASRGKLLCRNPRLSFHTFSVQVAEVDLDEVTDLVPEPDELSDPYREFARAGALALFDYLRKSKSAGFTLSLSGGADSSACAVMVAEMVSRASDELGWKNFWQSMGHPDVVTSNEKEAVHLLLSTAYQSTANSSPDTFYSARNLAESIGARFYHWS
ncbi:MAG: nitrilase-related carbon-nitrogen hydrolase, partial [Cyclobacteriaceae bacterium]